MENLYFKVLVIIVLFLIAIFYLIARKRIGITVAPPKNYSQLNFGSLFLSKAGVKFSLFKSLEIDDSAIYKHEEKEIYFFKSRPLVAGIPYSVYALIILKNLNCAPKIHTRIDSLKKKADSFYGTKIDFIERSETEEFYKMFEKSKFSLIYEPLWIEKNESGYLVVIQEGIKNLNFFARVEELGN